MPREPTRDELLRHFSTFRKYMPKEYQSWKSYTYKLSKVKKYIRMINSETEEDMKSINAIKRFKNRARALANKRISLIGKKCEICNELADCRHHHDGYHKPYKIHFLCLRHHGKADAYMYRGLSWKETKNILILGEIG